MAGFQLKALITGVDKLSPQLDGIRKKIAGFRKGIESTGFGKLGFSDLITGGAFAAPFIAGTKAAIEFESQMADVRKVVDFDTPEQFKKMGDDIINMSKRLPMAAEGLAQIVAAAGQSGIDKSELARFAEEAAKMGIAFDITAEESGDMMAKWRTAFKMTQDEVVGLADKINYLGNNGAAKAKEISDLVTRIGPLGASAGVSSAQVAALGSTIIGTGTQTEIAATGLKNFMLTLTMGAAATNKQKQAFKALRLSSTELAKGMQTDAEGTIKDVLTRISTIAPEKRTSLMTELFGRESVAAITPLVENLDLLKTNFNRISDATQYAGSMQKEYEARAATTANSIQLLKNQVIAASINLGNVFLPIVNDVVTTLSPFVGMIGDLIRDNPELIKQIAIVGATFIGAKLAVYGISKALAIMNMVLGMSPLGMFIRVAALGAGLIIANWKTVGPYFKAMGKDCTDALSDTLNMIRTLFGLDPVNWENAWKDMGLIIDDLRAKTTLLIEEFVKFRDAAKDYVPFKNKVATWMTGMDADSIYAQQDKGEGIYAMTTPRAPVVSPSSSIVNPQASKTSNEININLSAPEGTKVEKVTSSQPAKVNQNDKTGRRNMGVN